MDVAAQITYIIDTFEGGNAEKIRPGASYVEDPNDHGGETRWGITRGTLSEYLRLDRGALCPVEQIRDLTRDEAIRVGAEMVALRPGLYRIKDDRLRLLMLDYAFNSGDAQAVIDLQRVLALGVTTGHFGPQTEAAVNAITDLDLACEQLVARRLDFIGHDVERHPDQSRWVHGWLRRVGTILCYRVA